MQDCPARRGNPRGGVALLTRQDRMSGPTIVKMPVEVRTFRRRQRIAGGASGPVLQQFHASPLPDRQDVGLSLQEYDVTILAQQANLGSRRNMT